MSFAKYVFGGTPFWEQMRDAGFCWPLVNISERWPRCDQANSDRIGAGREHDGYLSSLGTSPPFTGSPPPTKTIGIVVVAAFAADPAG
jgi:hypothetical protein